MSVLAPARAPARDVTALLDAAERLLVEVGYAGLTSRRLAGEAGLDPGLIDYHFGSMDEVLVQVLDRFTRRMVERQRELYAAPGPFRAKWRSAMSLLEHDLGAGYPKVWCELQALAWNRPDLRERLDEIAQEWRTVLTDALSGAVDEYGLDRRRIPASALATLVMTFNEGILLERLSGVDRGHEELLDWVDGLLARLEKEARS